MSNFKKKNDLDEILLGIGSGTNTNKEDLERIKNSFDEKLGNVYNQNQKIKNNSLTSATTRGQGLFSIKASQDFVNHLNNKIIDLNNLNKENKIGNKPASIEAKTPSFKR